ncbi:MFS transporter [Streptomyces longwoodensis]|uniref:MFS transporter n=1 Tax=Streptomyces longwoodensis TaxID=68231 RepID=UPI0033EAE820
MVGSTGPRRPLLLGGASITAGALCLVGLTPHTSVLLLLAAYLLIGIGFGFANAPITNTAVNGLPTARADVAGAITSTARQLGAALGIALVTATTPAGLAAPAGPWSPPAADCSSSWPAQRHRRDPRRAPPPRRRSSPPDPPGLMSPCSKAGRQRAMRTAGRRR